MIGQIANTAFIGTPTGLSSHLELSNDSWTFGPQLLGQYGGSGRIYISNSGPADFRVQAIYIRDSSLSFSQSFMITGTSCGGIVNSPPRTLPPGDWCYVDFSFTPQSPGWQTAAMYIPEESLDSPHIIPLGGTGIGSTFSFQIPRGTLERILLAKRPETASYISTTEGQPALGLPPTSCLDLSIRISI